MEEIATAGFHSILFIFFFYKNKIKSQANPDCFNLASCRPHFWFVVNELDTVRVNMIRNVELPRQGKFYFVLARVTHIGSRVALYGFSACGWCFSGL